MAKKKRATKKKPRKAPVSVETLQMQAKECRNLLAAFDELVEAAADSGVAEFPLDGVQKFDRAMLVFGEYIDAASYSLSRAKRLA